MKTYQKIIIWTFIVLASILVLSTRVVEDPDYKGVPAGLSSGNISEADTKDQIVVVPQNNITTTITSHVSEPPVITQVTLLGLYPNETAMCTNTTWIDDVPAKLKEESIAAKTSRRNLNELAGFEADNVAIIMVRQSVDTEGIKYMDWQKDPGQKSYHWEYFAGPSKDGNSSKVGIYLTESTICKNTKWIMDEEKGNDLVNMTMILNMRNIMSQYNSTEIINGSTLYSLDGSRYVQGPAKYNKTQAGIYFKK